MLDANPICGYLTKNMICYLSESVPVNRASRRCFYKAECIVDDLLCLLWISFMFLHSFVIVGVVVIVTIFLAIHTDILLGPFMNLGSRQPCMLSLSVHGDDQSLNRKTVGKDKRME